MFKRNKKSTSTAPLVGEDDLPTLDEEEESDEQEADVESEEESEKEVEAKKETVSKETEEELTEEKIKEVLQNHELRLQRIEYHLRIWVL